MVADDGEICMQDDLFVSWLFCLARCPTARLGLAANPGARLLRCRLAGRSGSACAPGRRRTRYATLGALAAEARPPNGGAISAPLRSPRHSSLVRAVAASPAWWKKEEELERSRNCPTAIDYDYCHCPFASPIAERQPLLGIPESSARPPSIKRPLFAASLHCSRSARLP